ncbi:MAG: PH domain-containing protein [Halobacteria archaeon]|nr:PH domain-containing protein [Halobacteria archaeon]
MQTLTVTEPFLKRVFGYASLTVETAGYGPKSRKEEGTKVAVPLGKRSRVIELARTLHDFGEVEFKRPPKRTRLRYMLKYAVGVALLTAMLWGVSVLVGDSVGSSNVRIAWYLGLAYLPLAPIAAHYKWKHSGVYVGENHILTRNGFWTRNIKIVPYYRVQNVIQTQSIPQRRWGLATLTIDTAGSYVLNARAPDIDADYADRLLEKVNEELQDSLTRADKKTKPFRIVDVDEDESQNRKVDNESPQGEASD